MSNTLWPHGLQHTRLLCPSPSPQACSNSCSLSQWCHPTISSSVIPFCSNWQCFYWYNPLLIRGFYWDYYSIAKSCPTFCDPMGCSTPGFPVLHHLPEFAQTHVHWVDDAIQPSHPLLPPSPAFSLSQYQGLSQWICSLQSGGQSIWSFSISPSNEYSGLISFKIDWLDLLAVQRTLKNLFQHQGLFQWVSSLALGGQSIGASASVLPMNVHGWFPLGLTALISLLPKGLSKVFSTTTIWKHQFFGSQPSLWSKSHICTWLLEKPIHDS